MDTKQNSKWTLPHGPCSSKARTSQPFDDFNEKQELSYVSRQREGSTLLKEVTEFSTGIATAIKKHPGIFYQIFILNNAKW